MDHDTARSLLAPDGVFRVAINTGNRALVQATGDRLEGVSPALTRRLAEELGVSPHFRIFPGAGAVVNAAADWDVAFLAVEPARAGTVSFTAPYVTIEGTCAVRRGGPITRADQIDLAGQTILVATGAAYDHALSRIITQATFLRAANPGESFDRFLAGEGDCVAGVRQSLERRFGDNPDIVIFDQAILRIDQAMALPRRLDAALPFLDAFVARAKADGFVRAALDASGQGGLKVPE